MSTLHITNGDGAADLLVASSVPGDVLPWRDPMHHGPFPAGPDLSGLSAIRARYLDGGADPASALQSFRARDASLRAAATHDAIILWFEHDLLDQLQLLQILDWFAGADLSGTPLWMICIDRFQGVEPFRGLGQLRPDQIATLVQDKVLVSAGMLALAQAGWAAFRAPSPVALQAFADQDLGALPFLHAALMRHFQDYPDADTGLTRTEHQMLCLIADGVSDPVQLFVRNMDLETALYLGDWTSYQVIDRLAFNDLISCQPGPFWHPPASRAEVAEFRGQRLALTAKGRAVLAGECNAFGIILRDQWLGGVRVMSGLGMWTWDSNGAIFRAFPFIHEAYPAALKKFQHSSGVKRSQISPMASMS